MARRPHCDMTPFDQAPLVDVRRAADRFRTMSNGLEIRHAFSAGRHYDSANTSYGPLLGHDEIALGPGAGFAPHSHRDVEIVTWVLSGTLVHEDSAGHRRQIGPGVVQRLRAGDGVVHSELNGAPDERAHLVQMSIHAAASATPAYASCTLDHAELASGLVTLASGVPGRTGAVSLLAFGTALHVGRLSAGLSRELPDAPRVHLHVARGTVLLEGVDIPEDVGPLSAGDAVRLTGIVGGSVTAVEAAELLVWELPAPAP